MITLPAGYVGAIAKHPVQATTWRSLVTYWHEHCAHRLEQWHDGARVLPGFCSRPGPCGEVMRTEQVVPYVHTLYLAGMHTTVNQTALSLHALLTRRDQWQRLLDAPTLLDNAVEELLRFESTAQYMRPIY